MSRAAIPVIQPLPPTNITRTRLCIGIPQGTVGYIAKPAMTAHMPLPPAVSPPTQLNLSSSRAIAAPCPLAPFAISPNRPVRAPTRNRGDLHGWGCLLSMHGRHSNRSRYFASSHKHLSLSVDYLACFTEKGSILGCAPYSRDNFFHISEYRLFLHQEFVCDK